MEYLERCNLKGVFAMRSREDEDISRENALWRSSIKKMFQSGDLEGLIDLKESPEVLDEEILELLDKCINNLKNKEKDRSQAE